MNQKGLIIFLSIWIVTGCEITRMFEEPEEQVAPVVESDQPEPVCVFLPSEVEPEHNCELRYWLEYWVQMGGMPWQQRKVMLSELGESDPDTFKKILLSQGKETPYQSRLRAQNLSMQLKPRMTDEMRQLVEILIVQSSQERLEFESALAILTRLNTQQARTIEEKEALLKQQKMQLDKLLKIEASMMEKRGGINQ